jgi:hypothetical protein
VKHAIALLLCCAGCGTLASGAGAPENPPASGLGPSMPWSDDSGLSWTSPFIFGDPARTFSHPSLYVRGDELHLWVAAHRGDEQQIIHARAASFEQGFTETGEVIAATGGDPPSAPAAINDSTSSYVFYLSHGSLALTRFDPGGGQVPTTPLYTDPRGIDSVGAALVNDRVHLVILVGGQVEEASISLDAISSQTPPPPQFLPTGVAVPPYGIAFLDVGLRIETSPTGRLREDLLFAVSVPSTSSTTDLGTAAQPSAIGAASRYLDATTAYETVPLPILSGSPAPRGPALASYRGGTVLLYSARSGPRDAIGVARHP